jgi:hypothetical protein
VIHGELPPHKIYRGDDRRVVRVEPFGPQGLTLVIVHAWLDAAPAVTVPRASPFVTLRPGQAGRMALVSSGTAAKHLDSLMRRRSR